MTNQYKIEDNVPDTTEVTLANFQAHQSSIAAVDQFATEAYNEVYEHLGVLWTEAEKRQDVAAQTRLEAARQKAEQLKQTLQMNTANLSSVLEAAAHLGKKTQTIEQELSELSDAIYEYDTSHPLISSLVETVEQEVYNYIAESQDELREDIVAEAISEAWDEVAGQIKRQFPQSQWIAIHQFVAALDGEMPLNDIQRGLFISLLQTFAVNEAAAS